MNQPEQKRYLFDNPRNVSLVIRALYIVCILLILLDFIAHRHVVHDWDSLTGFYALCGFSACVIIVLTATQYRKFVKRKEEYYDADE